MNAELSNEGGSDITPNPSNDRTTDWDVNRYAAHLGVTVEELAPFQITRIWRNSQSVVSIPYFDATGNEVISVRYRTPNGPIWRTGDSAILYCQQKLSEAQIKKHIWLVEGESDCLILNIYGQPAVAIAGATTWKEERDAQLLDGIDTIYVVIECEENGEPDGGGQTVLKWLEDSAISDRVQLVMRAALQDSNDIREMHLKDPEQFLANIEIAKNESKKWTEDFDATRERLANEAEERAGDLLYDPQLVNKIKDYIRSTGYAGDLRYPLTVYMALTSRMGRKPINLALIGAASTGKNATIDAVTPLFPESAYYEYDAGSEKSFIYITRSFKNAVLIMSEADSIPDEGAAASAMRALAENNEMRYIVTIKSNGQFVAQEIIKQGPTGLLTTSTRSIAHQLGTRMFEIEIPDDPERTREILHSIFADTPELKDAKQLIAVQEFIEFSGTRDVSIPLEMREVIEVNLPDKASRILRDAKQLISMIKASAILHQKQRYKDSAGRIIATIDDYALAHELLAPIFDSIAQEGATKSVREAVQAVEDLSFTGQPVSVAAVAKQMKLAPSNASRHVNRALSKGYLINESTNRQRKELKLGDPLPDDISVLPDPSVLRSFVD